jgi:hypothetical protein
MSGKKTLRQAVADARKARYENGGKKPEFVSGDVAPGRVRPAKEKDEREGDESD